MIPLQRHLLASYMDYLVAHNAKVHYREVRPNPTESIATPGELISAINSANGIEVDCSGSISLLFHLAGCEPPSGSKNGWGYGNTETMLNYLPHYSKLSSASVGAIIVFNSNLDVSRQHAVVVRHTGKDPICFSHGSEQDPKYLRFSQLKPGFSGSYTLLNVSKL